MIRRVRVAALLVVMMVLGGCAAISARSNTPTRRYRLADTRGNGEMTIVVDSVEYRTELTRVYGHVDGTPHRAARIDGIAMTLSKGISHKATDIDGVDFNRWFQWEDEPSIPLEIDFSPMTPQDGFLIECHTPTGDFVWDYRIINRAAETNLKKR